MFALALAPIAKATPSPDAPAPVTFSPGSGVTVTSADERQRLRMKLRAQMRETVAVTEGEAEQVFEIRRARAQFDGFVFGRENRFKVELAFSPRDLGVVDGVVTRTPLLTWFIELAHLRDLTVRLGQYKVPYSRERVLSSGRLQLVDRSLANSEFNHDRDIGLDLRSYDLGGLGWLRAYAGLYMGEGRDFGSGTATPDFRLHYLSRVEVVPGDDPGESESDLSRDPAPRLLVGVAYSFHDRAQRLRGVLGPKPTDGGTTSYHSATLDLHVKAAGWSALGAFHWRSGRRHVDLGAVSDAPRSGYGWNLQGGYLFAATPVELVARYSGVRGLGETEETSLGRADDIAMGVGYYFSGHPFKLQADVHHRRGTTAREMVYRTQLQLSL